MKASLLIVGNFLSSQGGTRAVGEELAERLQRAGHSVITTSRQRSRPLRLLDMLFTAWRRRKEYRLAYVEVFSGPAFLWAEAVCLVLLGLKKTFILALHGGNLPTFAHRQPQRVRRLLACAQAVTAPSHYLQEEMQPYREDIRLIPNPIEIQLCPFRLRLQPAARLVWLRAFHEIYNPQMAPLVMAELKRTFPDIALTMVGPDKGDGTFHVTQKRLKELGLQNNIEIIPGIPKVRVPATLAQADIFINTARVDNAPVSVLEAMACGMCIVSTNVGGIPYLLTDGEDALLVSPDDPRAMATAVERILTEPSLAGNLSRNARRKAEEFDWSIILPKWQSLFNEIHE